MSNLGSHLHAWARYSSQVHTIISVSLPQSPDVATHRDCAAANIMMDAKTMYPGGFHPTSNFMDPTMIHLARYFTRSECPVKYLICLYSPRRIPQACGGVEMSWSQGTRIIQNGALWPVQDRYLHHRKSLQDRISQRKIFFILPLPLLLTLWNSQKYLNVDFLTPLTTALTQQDPSQRPDADGALHRPVTWIASSCNFRMLSGQYILKIIASVMGVRDPCDIVLWP